MDERKRTLDGSTGEGSARRAELLAAAYRYACSHGLTELSLRPLAAATATSPRVLLYLFGSKDELVREILAVARREQLQLIADIAAEPLDDDVDRYAVLVHRLWTWLSAPEQRSTIRLWLEAYTRSLHPEPGPWEGFARRSVVDWIDVLVDAQPGVALPIARGRATHTLALLRGLLLDLLAGGDRRSLTTALDAHGS
jgi:AcrR family transcriptional regulator